MKTIIRTVSSRRFYWWVTTYFCGEIRINIFHLSSIPSLFWSLQVLTVFAVPRVTACLSFSNNMNLWTKGHTKKQQSFFFILQPQMSSMLGFQRLKPITMYKYMLTIKPAKMYRYVCRPYIQNCSYKEYSEDNSSFFHQNIHQILIRTASMRQFWCVS